MITSKSNAQYKKIRKLITSSKARKEEGLFVVEGERIVKEAPLRLIDTICVSESYAASKKTLQGTLVFSDEVFRYLSDTVNPQGIMAVVRQPSYTLEGLIKEKSEKALYLLLDDIRDPGNLGTIIRTAEAAGTDGVILSEGCADIFNPKVIRSTMGSIYRLPFVTASLCEAIGLLKKADTEVYGTALDAELLYDQVDYAPRAAFVIGNEARGISREVLGQVTEKIKIPMAGKVESLNAAVSAAVVLYGYRR